ncbi:MAG: GGDEF domain-containing protein, partial [Gammaproteobacteria bacterium SHHR-1]
LTHLAKREHQQLTVAVLDIDDFKRINDRFGHDRGDQVLLELVDLIRANTRDSDLLARFGGEEFVLLLPNTAPAEALPVMENIRHRVFSADLLPQGRVTISIGLGGLREQDYDITLAIKEADKWLYQAKGSGKNRVCWGPVADDRGQRTEG